MTSGSTICVYCGANPGNNPTFIETARALGGAMAAAGHRLVYGGGRVGLMGAVADGALEAGGEVIGIIPNDMVEREVAHHGVTELIVTANMHERKAEMEQRSNGFIALPGGFGTLDETMEMLTWNQIGYVRKPVVFLDVDGYWAPLFAFLDSAMEYGLLKSHHRQMARVADTVADALSMAVLVAPETVSKWTDPTINSTGTDTTGDPSL